MTAVLRGAGTLLLAAGFLALATPVAAAAAAARALRRLR